MLLDILGEPSFYKFAKGKENYVFRRAHCAVTVSDTIGGNSKACAGVIRARVPLKHHRCCAFNGSADGAIRLSGLIYSTATRGLAICWFRKNSIVLLINVHKGCCIAPPLTLHVRRRGHVRSTLPVSCSNESPSLDQGFLFYSFFLRRIV